MTEGIDHHWIRVATCDQIPPRQGRSVSIGHRELAIFNLGPPLGSALGVALGASLAAAFDWRIPFYVIGITGILAALAVYMLVKEPVRGAYDPEYLYYTLGKLQILNLREDYRTKKGSAFTLEEFHNSFMQQGFPPIKIVRKALLGDDSPTL